MSVIYTTHYMEEAQRLCHRVAIVDEGELIALDTPTALIRSLGGGILVVGIAESAPEDLPDRIVESSAVKSAARTDGQLKIETHRLQEALIGVLDITNKLDVPITSIEMLEPNLESVFLHLTGKKLRE
jgi:ABC-2 type transport system ATP-binding protein